jgi:hypothetical protein
LPAPLLGEPKEKSPLIEEMPDRAEELFLPSSKGAGLAIIPLSAKADIPLFKGDFLKLLFAHKKRTGSPRPLFSICAIARFCRY